MHHSSEHARRSAASGARAPLWTPERAERHLRSLELFGMRFGLDRMRRMMTALGSPQRRFAAVQVLGTNGKSSTTRMIAAILERHGLRTGVYTSPHLVSYHERVRIGEREVSPEAFAQAIGRAVRAAERVDRTLAGDDHVTQFELLTAAALSEMAEQRVEVAVVEAGLGGRYDATSVIDAPLTVLTNVALEHTRWLGPTVGDIAGEKLAVVRPAGTLVLGAGLAPEALAVAERVAAQRGARVVFAAAASSPAPDPRAGLELRAAGTFQHGNFALARTAAQTWLEGAQDRTGRAGRSCGRAGDRGAGPPAGAVGAEPLASARRGAQPATPIRGAGARRCPGSWPARAGWRSVLGVLEDKDAAEHAVAMLLPLLRARVVHGAGAVARALLAGGAAVAGAPAGLRGPRAASRTAARALAEASRAGRRRARQTLVRCSSRAPSTSIGAVLAERAAEVARG